MARIKVFTRKAELGRNRAKKYREKRRFVKAYQRAVDAEINMRNHADASTDHGHDIDSSDVREKDNEDKNDFTEKLKLWIIQHRITKRAVNDLLSILIVYGFQFLPRDSRTLLKTPTHVDIRQLSSGHLWYYGIENCLKLIFQNIKKKHHS